MKGSPGKGRWLVLAAALCMVLAASPLGAAKSSVAKKEEPSKGVDKATLRSLIPMPQVLYSFYLGTEDFERHEPDGKKRDFAREAVGLRARLDGSVRDAEVYRELTECYRIAGQAEKRLETAHKAEELLRPLLPRLADARLLATYCEVKAITTPFDKKGREKWARRATQKGPAEWRGWAQLGAARFSQLCNIISGRDDYRIPTGPPQNLVADLARLKPSAAALEAAEKCLQESESCIEKVRQLAPRDAQARRACFLAEVGTEHLQKILAVLRGQQPQQRLTRSTALVGDVRALAEACPEQVGYQVHAVMWEIVVGEQVARRQLPSGFRPLNPEDRKRVQGYLDRLAKAAQNKDAEAAAFCGRYLASLHMRLGEPEEADRQARRALEHDPTLAQMWELRAICMDQLGQPADAVAAARSWIRHGPSGRAHLVLARGLLKMGRLVEAEQSLRDGLELAPNDSYCTLGLAAVLMHKSGEANTLLEVGQLLERGRSQLAQGGPFELVSIFPSFVVINEGLNDRVDRARELMGQLCGAGQENDFARQVRAALGR